MNIYDLKEGDFVTVLNLFSYRWTKYDNGYKLSIVKLSDYC